MKTKDLILYAILGCITFILKFIMAPLPNIEPVTLLIMLYAYNFKWNAIFPVSVYIMLEFLIYGFSWWSVGYCYIWFILVILSIIILPRINNKFAAMLLAQFFGFVFGALYIPIYVITGGWEMALTWWVAGISYDAIHGIGNAVMAFVLYEPMCKVFKSLRERY